MKEMNEGNGLLDLFDLIPHLLKRPAMYGISSVRELNIFIFGYSSGARGAESEVYQDFQSDFREFVNEDFAEDFTKKTDYDWARLIRFNSSDDLQSIKLFELLYERFPKQKYINRLVEISLSNT